MSGTAPMLARLFVDGAYYGALRSFPRAAPMLGRVVAAGMLALSPALRRTVTENARLALGPRADDAEVARVALDMLRNMQRSIAETLLSEGAGGDRLADRVRRFSGQEDYHRARDLGRASGHGLVVASIHMGAFEPCLALLRRFEPRVHVLFQPDPMPSFERARSSMRNAIGVVEHPVSDGLGAWMAIRDALHAGDVVVLHADRVMPAQRGSRMRFLGADDAVLPTGPARLALEIGAPIVPVFCSRCDDGFEVEMADPIVFPPAVLRGDEVARHPAQLRLLAAMEHAIRKRPGEWLALAPIRETPR